MYLHQERLELIYSEGQEKAKIGRVQVDKRGNSYRLRFTYPESTRHQFTVSKATPEGWVTAIKAAQLINRDIDLGDFDETYARYSPKHAKKLVIAQQEQTKEYNLKELWEMYKESNKNRVAKTTQKYNWTQFDRFLEKVDQNLLQLNQAKNFVNKLLTFYAVSTIATNFRTCLHPSVNQAVRQKLILSNPYNDVPLPKVFKKEIECFEPNEIKAIIAAFYSDDYARKYSKYKHSYYALMVEFLCLTGCRPEECYALTWDDIKYKKDKVFMALPNLAW